MLSSLNLESVICDAITQHLEVIRRLDAQLQHLEVIAIRMTQAVLEGRKVLWCGNGGSASDAQHLAAEFVGRYRRDRPGLASIALSSNVAAVTGIANDFGFQDVFARQVEALCNSGDVFVGISTSGNSRNVYLALTRAREMGAFAVAITGEHAGKLGGTADVWVRIPSRDTARIQEALHALRPHTVRLGGSVHMHLQCDGRAAARRMTSGPANLVSLVRGRIRTSTCVGCRRLDARQVCMGRRGAGISPEAPVPVLRTVHHTEQPGGAANVAMNLAGLGAHATVVGCGGGDEDQCALEGLLCDAGVQYSIVVSGGAPTTTKLRVLAGHQQLLRIDHEVKTGGCAVTADALLEQVGAALPRHRSLCSPTTRKES